jgi:hypothetical protein
MAASGSPSKHSQRSPRFAGALPARVLLGSQDMTHDDAHTSHNHGFELPNAPHGLARRESRPWRAVAGVAVCLALAGIVTGLIVARRQSVSDEHVTADALQREELRDGWKALAAAAAQDAQDNAAQAAPAAAPASAVSTPAAAPPPNVVIVNVPAQSPAAAPPNVAPSNVTNINLPSEAPNQSLPALNFSPVPGYLPQYNAGASTSGVPPLTPAVGNGSIPGSTTNPALPNNGLVGSPALPGQPNGLPNGNGTSSAPVGGVSASPGTTSLPSGFSAP